jgi:hypothetical protein
MMGEMPEEWKNSVVMYAYVCLKTELDLYRGAARLQLISDTVPVMEIFYLKEDVTGLTRVMSDLRVLTVYFVYRSSS